MEKDNDVTKKVVFWIVRIAVILVVIIALCILFRRITYKNNLRKATELISYGVLETEYTGNYVYEVFRNWTLEIDDSDTNYYTTDSAGRFYKNYEDVFYNIEKDRKYQNLMTSIDSYTKESDKVMKKLSKYPYGFEDDYSLVLIYYNDYCKLVEFINNPDTDIRLYRDSFISYDSQAAKDLELLCNKIGDIFLPEEMLKQYDTKRSFDVLGVSKLLNGKKKEPWVLKYIDK